MTCFISNGTGVFTGVIIFLSLVTRHFEFVVALEKVLSDTSGKYCVGDTVSHFRDFSVTEYSF